MLAYTLPCASQSAQALLPQLCPPMSSLSLHLHCCPANRLISAVFLASICMLWYKKFVFLFLTLYNTLKVHPCHQNCLRCLPFYGWEPLVIAFLRMAVDTLGIRPVKWYKADKATHLPGVTSVSTSLSSTTCFLLLHLCRREVLRMTGTSSVGSLYCRIRQTSVLIQILPLMPFVS